MSNADPTEHTPETPPIDLTAYWKAGASWEAELYRKERRSRKIAWTVATVAGISTMLSLSALNLLVPLKQFEAVVVIADKTTGFVEVARSLNESKLSENDAIKTANIVRYKTAMRPLMRPDELGSMNETRCIIKLRNQQPILGVRNFYYADKELTKRAWLQMRAPSKETSVEGVGNFEFEVPEAGPFPVSASQIISIPGAKFAANSSAVLRKPPSQLQPEQFHELPEGANETPRPGQNSDPSCTSPAPDFKSALDASALRKAGADQSIEKILTIFKSSPAKKRAAKKVRKEVTLALADE